MILQKINSNVISSFSSEQLDWALNEEMNRFIKQRFNITSNDKKLGFQSNEKRYDDLKSLITSKTLPSYINDVNSVYTYLPSDYFSLINDRSLTKDLCGNVFKSTDYDTQNLYSVIIPYINDPVNKYSTFQIIINSVVVFDINNYPQFVGGLPSIESKFELIDFILEELRNAGYEAKMTSSNSFYITSNNIFTISFVLFSGATNFPVTLTTLSKFKTITSGIEVTNRLTKTEDLYNILDSTFNKTTAASPISNLYQDRLIVHHNQKFILSNIKIDYIRKPKKISLPLEHRCELDESLHQEIVEDTAKRIAGLVGSQLYNNITNENINKE